MERHKTLKKTADEPVAATAAASTTASAFPTTDERFKNLLEAGAREAYSRPWHRIERGLRLNRLRIFVEEIAPQYSMTKEEKDDLFLFLQKALDKKQLNTLKVVQYDLEAQRIVSIKGLELKRAPDGLLKGTFGIRKPKADATRKKRKGDEMPSVSTILSAATSAATAAASSDDKIDETTI
jgi:hypothetical protein